MTPNEIKIAIATILGRPAPFTSEDEYEETSGIDGDSCFISVLRDANGYRILEYSTDLNACHYIEKWLKTHATGFIGADKEDTATDTYIDHLLEIVGDSEWSFMNATAAQRTQAFLMTMGKWQEPGIPWLTRKINQIIGPNEKR